MKSNINLFSTIFIILISASCHKDQTPPPTYTDQGSIGKEGGIVKTDDGASVEIPVGALNSNRTISLTNITEGDTIANNGCQIYELNPSGLVFSDSVSITLPFDDKYINSESKEVNYGVNISVFQDSEWVCLNTKINLENRTIETKTKHFSTYMVSYPGGYASYFRQNKSSSPVWYYVPYYLQSRASWCSYYSLSMITKYAGYPYKAPFFAALLNNPTNNGLDYLELTTKLDPYLSNYSIKTEIASPPWSNMENLCGYILQQLNIGRPVLVTSTNIHHTIVVVGHDYSCFYVNDPSGTFVNLVYPNNGNKLGLVDIPYEKFCEVLLNNSSSVWAVWTLVITSEKSPNYKFAGSLNFTYGGFGSILIKDKDGSEIGHLILNGQSQPNGYSLSVLGRNDNNLEGSHYLEVSPLISNNDTKNDLIANINYKIDGTVIKGSPVLLEPITKGNNFYLAKNFTFQLSNLRIGKHTLTVELVSRNDPGKNDYWEFPFEIANEFVDTGTITDIDGNVYKTVVIGNQTWMAENLKTSKYVNGAIIPSGLNNTDWSSTTSGACSIYNNNNANDATYGKLYNWYALVDSRKLCPTGWHAPSEEEWTTMINYLGLSSAGGQLKETGTTHWQSPNTNSPHLTGFSALPGGYKSNLATFNYLGLYGFWWSTSGRDYVCHYDLSSVGYGDWSKNYGFSVRCIKDN
jgi:uncharacterized protein (TIGR02145 family)